MFGSPTMFRTPTRHLVLSQSRNVNCESENLEATENGFKQWFSSVTVVVGC